MLGDWGFDRKLSLGKGLCVLFAGPPGTGKTMAADLIANELRLDVYKIDLSQVVSKYIGETEKNLSRIFSEARASNAIIFFDEADALFGKRSEVRDAHDQYANIEIGYLLQKMEEYEGDSILVTNLRQNLDPAFTRRLTFSVDVPFPDEASRLLIAGAARRNAVDLPSSESAGEQSLAPGRPQAALWHQGGGSAQSASAVRWRGGGPARCLLKTSGRVGMTEPWVPCADRRRYSPSSGCNGP